MSDERVRVGPLGCLVSAALLGAAWGLAIGVGVLVYRVLT